MPGDESIAGMYSVPSRDDVQLVYRGFVSDGVFPLESICCEAWKLDRSELISSMLDFCVVGRRITDGAPPFITFLGGRYGK